MLSDNRYCQKVFEMLFLYLIWQSVLDYMQTFKQLLGYFIIYRTDSNVETEQ